MDAIWEACTLPTAEQPLRVAEFDQLFAEHLEYADRVDPQTLDLTLDPDARATTENLIARESECCAFFTFTINGATSLRITVPPAYTAVLDGLTARLPR
jgi:hypothetical protein